MENVSLKKEVGKFLGFFLILYLVVFVVLNITGWLVRPPEIETPPDVLSSQENESSEHQPESTEEPECVFSERPDSILIPKIGIEAPIVFPESEDEKVLKKELNKGVVHHPSSPLPGQEGQVIILGHSAPAGWPKIRYDWVFSDLNKLEAGDEIFIFFKNCQYTYKVSQKIFLEKGEELSESPADSEHALYLISCWPPGKDIRRIAVLAVLDKNN